MYPYEYMNSFEKVSEGKLLDKCNLYEFHYKYFKSNFDANLLFTDTDSLAFGIKTEDFYEDSYEDKNLFDFSNYSLNLKVL